MPATAGSTAIASNPATRATALFTPDAMPARLAGTAANTVAVSGATTHDKPSPNTTTGRRTSGTYFDPGQICRIINSATDTTNGPTVIGPRGPIRWATAPARADSASMISVTGKRPAPA